MSPEGRLEAAQRLVLLDTDALVSAVLDESPDFLMATQRFVTPEDPPTGPGAQTLLAETEATIALLERRLTALAEELGHLPRSTTPLAETGTRVDLAG